METKNTVMTRTLRVKKKIWEMRMARKMRPNLRKQKGIKLSQEIVGGGGRQRRHRRGWWRIEDGEEEEKSYLGNLTKQGTTKF
jgi:hypothetical protein